MEGMNNRMKSSGKTLESDPAYRLQTRPGSGQGYRDRENLEKSTLGRRDKAQGSKSGSWSSSEARGNKFKPAEASRSGNVASSSSSRGYGKLARSTITEEDEDTDDDDDELDLLSGASSLPGSDFDPSTSQKPVHTSRGTYPTVTKNTHISTKDVKTNNPGSRSKAGFTELKTGIYHEYHPDFLPKKKELPSFKKTKTEDVKQGTGYPSSSLSTSLYSVSKENKLPGKNGPSSRHLSSDHNAVLDLTLSSPVKAGDDSDARSASPLSGKSANSNRPATPSSASGSRLPLPGRNRYGTDDTPKQDAANARPAMRPRPRPVVKAQTTHDVADVRQNIRRKDIGLTASTTKTGLSRSRSESVQIISPKPKRKGTAPFPFKAEDMLRGSTQVEETPKVPRSSVRKPQKFPLLASEATDKGKGKEIMDINEDGSDEEEKKGKRRTRLKPKVFPLSKELFASTSTSPESRSFGSMGKRSSEAGSGDERTSKKSRKEFDKYFRPAKRRSLPFEEEGDSMSIAPRVDPRTLCPFCDTPLPSDLTPLLTSLMEATRKKATEDPRPTNPLGLKAPLTTYITVCQRHRFETKILPEAERKGWPKTIKWKKVSGRVLKMKDFLQALIEDPGNDSMSESRSTEWEVLVTANVGKQKKRKKGPKARSIFWMEFMSEVEKKGLRAMSGFQGQYANFDKAQPGYYGEMGSVIIHQTLYNMFPLSDIDPLLILPLTPTEFIQRILVPEVALRLIMEDRGLEGEGGMKEALEILRESSAYGVAMFPEDAGESGATQRQGGESKMGAGDMIVMERARKRRKELAEEEAKEDEERRLQEELDKRIKEQKAKEKLRSEKKTRQKDMDSSEPSEPEARPRPRPRPIPPYRSNNNPPSACSDASTDDGEAAPRGSHRAVNKRVNQLNRSGSFSVARESPYWDMEQDRDSRSRSRSRSSASTGSDVEIEEYITRRPSSEERKRSPSASESRFKDSRAPSHVSDCDSESSNKAVVGAGGKSHAKGRTGGRSKIKSDNTTPKKVDSSDSEVQFVEFTKTPIPKKIHTYHHDEETPRPSKKQDDAPLERARSRAKQNLRARSKTEDDYKFIHSSQG